LDLSVSVRYLKLNLAFSDKKEDIEKGSMSGDGREEDHSEQGWVTGVGQTYKARVTSFCPFFFGIGPGQLFDFQKDMAYRKYFSVLKPPLSCPKSAASALPWNNRAIAPVSIAFLSS
jgi:hypothetical protein